VSRPAPVLPAPPVPHADPADQAPEALFREARARRRKRWLLGSALLAVVLAAALLTSVLTIGSTKPTHGPAIHRTTPTAAPSTGAPLLAWVDYFGNLHIGNASTGAQKVVGHAKASPTTPLVSLHGRLFWVATGCSYATISKCPYLPASGVTRSQVVEFDPATNKTVSLGRGNAIFAGAGGRSLFVVRPRSTCPDTVLPACDPAPDELVQISLGPGGTRRVLPVPTGWYVNAGNGYANPISVAGGILVQSARAQVSSTPPELGIWNPTTGHIRPLGRDWGLIDAYTAPGGRSSLLAWLPGACEDEQGCAGLRITDTETGRAVTVPSPLPYGFDIGGAFSPDGSRLAVFVKTNSGDVNPSMQLAIVDATTGSLRLIPGVEGEIGESVGWARWLPGGTSVLAGTFSSEYRTYNHYLVDTETGAVKLVDFSANRNLDVNFSSSTIGGLALPK
jgi:hypothetical protein